MFFASTRDRSRQVSQTSKKSIEERLCRNCNVVENEFHFLFECPLYVELRTQYIDKYFYENPNHFKLKTLFQSTRENEIKNLSILSVKLST